MLSRSGVRVFASAAKDNTNKPAARVVPKASLNDTPKMFKETGAEAPMPTASLNFTTTPFDNYKFAPIREATVSTCLRCMQHCDSQLVSSSTPPAIYPGPLSLQ